MIAETRNGVNPSDLDQLSGPVNRPGKRHIRGGRAAVNKRVKRCDSLTGNQVLTRDLGGSVAETIKDVVLTTRKRCRCNSYPGGEPVMQLPQDAA